MLNAGKAYDHCFYESVFAQMKARRADDNYDMMSERAFAACATEESAMVLLAQTWGVPAQTITITLTGLRVSLKRTVRDIVANPAKYAKWSTFPRSSGLRSPDDGPRRSAGLSSLD
jgi:hypothetical protein